MKSVLVICLAFICLLSPISADSTTDYCLLEGPSCLTHIACNKTEISRDVGSRDQTNSPMPDDIRVRVLDIYNRYKNDVAIGKAGNVPNAANLTVIQWSDELEHLIEIASDKLVYSDLGFNFCYDTPTLSGTLMKTTYYKNYDVDDIFKKLDHTFNDRVARLRFGPRSMYFFSHMHHIACRFVTYLDPVDNADSLAIRCIYSFAKNGNIPISATPPYHVGKPCSMCNTECSTDYPGLCQS